MPPLSTAKTLYYFYAILKASQAMSIAHDTKANIFDSKYNKWSHIV
jgi:hypothetical protein